MKLSNYFLFPEGAKASIHNTWSVSATTGYYSRRAERQKPGRDTMVTQYQKNLTVDVNTTMVLYPGYIAKNVKTDEDVGLDDLYQSLLT